LPFQPPEFTENQFVVVKKLKGLGYQVKIVDEEILVSDSHNNYVGSTIPVMQISW
jgi:hypothetical protein